MTVIYGPKPRYVVETANTIVGLAGRNYLGAWQFRFAFHQEADAKAAADRLAEENEHVRVIDRTESEEN